MKSNFPGFLFLKIRGEIRVLLDGMALPLATFRYGAKKQRDTGQKYKGPARHALTNCISSAPGKVILTL
jgi:hypothetical protein